MVEKAAVLPADEVVIDLEDGVAPPDKDAARANLDVASAQGTLAVRINAVGTPWFERDLEAVVERRPEVVVLPKAELEHLALVGGLAIEVQIETARALVDVERIAMAGVEALIFGPGDFAASLGVPVLTIGAAASEYAMARIAVAARAFGLQAIDGPHAAIDDVAELRASAERALALGYDGKWAIHPGQLETLHDVFTPSADAIERAKRILATRRRRAAR